MKHKIFNPSEVPAQIHHSLHRTIIVENSLKLHNVLNTDPIAPARGASGTTAR